MLRMFSMCCLVIVTFLMDTWPLIAQEVHDGPEPYFGIVWGPRLGVTYVGTSVDRFSDEIRAEFETSGRTYYPVFSQFGFSLEQRIQIGTSDNAFLLQGTFLIGGLDQAIFIPSLSGLFGIRWANGFEAGVGPNLTPRFRTQDELDRSEDLETGFAIAIAVGYTFDLGGVYVPLNFALVPPNVETPARYSLLTGFNFRNW